MPLPPSPARAPGNRGLRFGIAALGLVLTAGCGAAEPTAAAGTAPMPATDLPEAVPDCGSLAADGRTAEGGEGLPALRLPCLRGDEQVSLDDLGSRPVLVNLWASWCAPCREEMPLLQDTFERYGDQVTFLGVNTEDPRPAAVSMLTDFGITYPQVVDTDRELLEGLGVPGLPVTVAVAADGRVVDRQIGQLSESRLEDMVSSLAASRPTAPGS